MSDSLIGVLSVALGGLALVVACVAARYTKKQADHTRRQADAADAALTASAESNRIAQKALAEAEAVRELAHREWHRNAQPVLTVTLSGRKAKPKGYELTVQTDQDLDSCTLELAEGTQLTEATGLSVGLTETIFSHNTAVKLRDVKAGSSRHPALWLAPSADGVTVHLRCTITIGDETWGPIVREISIPAAPRISRARTSGRRIED